MKVLIVEDEVMLREGLADLLAGAGHEVVAVGDGLTAVERGTAEAFDMVVLDLMLPRLDGIEVCRRLRLARPALSVLMLTARGGEGDKVVGLATGADDYMTKPFGVRELLARVDAFARRLSTIPSAPDLIEFDGLALDLGRCVARRASADASSDEVHTLTAREVGLLRWLHRHRARAVTRAELLEHVWGVSPNVETRTVDVTIGNLRKKIERDPQDPRVIVSVKGVGYAWGTG